MRHKIASLLKHLWLPAVVIGLIMMTCVVVPSIVTPHHHHDHSIANYGPTLYVRAGAVYDGKIDQRFSLDKDVMKEAAASFVGCPVLMGHEWADPNAAIGIIKASALRYDPVLKQYYIEMILEIKSDMAIEKIKLGLFNKLSIGFVVDKMICPLDGKDMRFCKHNPGQYYEEGGVYRLARGIIKSFLGKELSFINVPASPPARVLEWSYRPLELSVSK